jgi:5-(aminomethyl)-3-furanmethanol phosphate kinase
LSLVVAKLGGSLADSPQREAWLAALAASARPLILVPGGGPFARAVRAAQASMQFDDVAAHRLALLAMEQFGVVLAAYSDRYALASSRREIEAAIGAGRIPVWLPSSMTLSAPDIPPSWDATSDSLAAWLAGVFAARCLLLIKSCDLAAPISLDRLAASKIVDPLFPRFAARSGALISIAGPASLPFAKAALQSGKAPGALVPPEPIDAQSLAPA